MLGSKSPFDIIKHRHVTEKSQMLQNLKSAKDNRSCLRTLKRFSLPKYVFIVDLNANKQEIKAAIEEIYKERNVRVVSVNTVTTKGKVRRVRGRFGVRSTIKKAIVTLEEGDSLDNV